MLKLAQNTSISTEPIYKFQNNHSLEFDGTESLDLGEPISYTQHTISTWVKITNTGSSKIIFDARDSSGDGIRIRTNASEQILYELNSHTLTTPLGYVDEWIHIVATYDGTTQKLFINSSLIDSSEIDEEITTTTNAKIGTRNFDTPAVFFVGNIDEIGIWDRALSAEEIEEIYRIKYGANLVQNGRFDELSNELVSNPNFTMGADLIQNGSLDELGSELAINGTFDTSIAIGTTGSGWTLSSGTAEYFNGGIKVFDEVANDARLRMRTQTHSQVTIEQEKTYKIQYEIKDFQGDVSYAHFSIYASGISNQIPISKKQVGNHTVYVESGSNANGILQFQVSNSMNGFVVFDNISVKQVDPNNRWSLDTGWAYSNNGVTCSSGNGTFQTNGLTLTDATFHKLTFDIVNYESGNLKVDLGNSATDATFTSAGSKTIFINSGGFRRPRFYGGAFRGTISNITVQEISGWSVSQYRGFAINNNGHLEINSSLVEDTGSITYASLSLSSSPFDIGKTYKVVITDLNVTSGAFELKYGRTHSSTPARPIITSADNGTYVEYFEAVNVHDDITLNNLGGTLATLSSISIKEVDPNDRWTLGTGWSYGDGIASCDGTQSSVSNFETTNGFSIQNKTVKVTFDLVRTAGDLTVTLQGTGSNDLSNLATSGTYTFIATSVDATSKLIFKANVGFIGSITNVMLEQQKYVASNLKLKSGNYTPFAAGQSSGTFALKNYYRMGDGILDRFPLICDMMQPSLGSNLVVNGNFASDDNWTADSNWEITENLAISDGTQTGNVSLFQENTVNNFVTGKLYKVEFTISNYVAGVINPHIRGQASGNVSGNGLKTAYITAGSGSHGINLYAGSTFAGSISNVSAKQVNGVAGIMTNMSAGNITNDVPRLS